MLKQAINNYYRKIDKYKRFGGTRNETSIRRAFANLLEEYCLSKNLILIDELKLENSAKRPDGTVNSATQIAYGHYESKDEKDNLDDEIKKKIKIGYPTFNILFENTKEIVLIQKDVEVMRGKIQNPDFLHKILNNFVEYEHPRITKFNQAVEKFKEDVPYIIELLREMIAEQANNNPDFRVQRDKFWTICKDSINPNITAFDIREMLIQHILTAEIFNTVFGDSHFHRENNIAKELEIVINTFFTGEIRRNTLALIDNYYKVIKREASNIEDHHKKQKFLKVVYEIFYQAYNPKGADTLGVIYTPNEIVQFMVKSTDFLLGKYFSKSLHDKNVQILDPATGTGTFITEIIEYIPKKYLEYKYKNEIHCNELAVLPYYISNLNIEYTYQQKMEEYKSFENIVFVDTLENLGFNYAHKEKKIFDLSTENSKRIKKQNKGKISVIIGNPPYNANQQNESDNNKNKEYKEIDKLIKNTYVHLSSAQKTKVYDMYARFYRWATHRIAQNGIIAFVTNRSFIDSRTFDGFRKSVEKEFDYIYLVDLNGDIRANKEQVNSNVFGIMTGVAIAFFIKKEKFDLNNKKLPKEKARIKYTSILKKGSAKEKLKHLSTINIEEIPFESIVPDNKNYWLNIPNNNFEELLPVCNKQTKLAKRNLEINAVFKLYSLGVVTNRDDWVYDFSEKNLEKKVKYFIKKYKSEQKRWQASNKTEGLDNFLHKENLIKWTRAVKKDFSKRKKYKFEKEYITKCLYRPFVKKNMYFKQELNEMQYQNRHIFGEKGNLENKIIAVNKSSQTFHLLSSNLLADLHFTGDSLCLPFYNYHKGQRIDNITNWGLEQFREHYELKNILKITKKKIENDFAKHRYLLDEPLFKITKEAIFYYTYAVFHNPEYKKKYKINLKRELPRLPFYKNFWKWADWGEKLMNLHINYETVEKNKNLIIKNEKLIEEPIVKLKIDKNNNEIIIDENTTITKIPKIAFDYKLGNRSAIEWILNQYKEKKIRDKTIAENFDFYKFADYKNEVIDLIKQVTTVSIETLKIINKMKQEHE